MARPSTTNSSGWSKRAPPCWAAFKHAIRKGVQVFEALESETTRKGGPNLIEALCSLPQALSRYSRQREVKKLLDGGWL
jgi:hypothetical protein